MKRPASHHQTSACKTWPGQTAFCVSQTLQDISLRVWRTTRKFEDFEALGTEVDFLCMKTLPALILPTETDRSGHHGSPLTLLLSHGKYVCWKHVSSTPCCTFATEPHFVAASSKRQGMLLCGEEDSASVSFYWRSEPAIYQHE